MTATKHLFRVPRQGYKFNIFYPDLLNPTEAPRYFFENDPNGSRDTMILRFNAGPPYEDIAFRCHAVKLACWLAVSVSLLSAAVELRLSSTGSHLYWRQAAASPVRSTAIRAQSYYDKTRSYEAMHRILRCHALAAGGMPHDCPFLLQDNQEGGGVQPQARF